jgi:ABC-type molybdate transport system substrate-binding protein
LSHREKRFQVKIFNRKEFIIENVPQARFPRLNKAAPDFNVKAKATANEFVDFLASPAGAAIFKKWGWSA